MLAASAALRLAALRLRPGYGAAPRRKDARCGSQCLSLAPAGCGPLPASAARGVLRSPAPLRLSWAVRLCLAARHRRGFHVALLCKLRPRPAPVEMRGKAAAFHQIVPVAVGPLLRSPARAAAAAAAACCARLPPLRLARARAARPLSAAPLRRGSLSPAELRPQTGAAPRRGRPSCVWGPFSGGLRAPWSVALAVLRPSPVPARPTRCGPRVGLSGLASRRSLARLQGLASAAPWRLVRLLWLWLRPRPPPAVRSLVGPCASPAPSPLRPRLAAAARQSKVRRLRGCAACRSGAPRRGAAEAHGLRAVLV